MSLVAVVVLILSGQLRFYFPEAISTIPVTAQSMVVILIGILLRSCWGTLSVITYIILGILGTPVFPGWKGGIWILTDSSFGYLVGFVIATFTVGKLTELRKRAGGFKTFEHFTIGTFIILSIGTLWNSFSVGIASAFMYGFVPFIPGGIIKILIGAFLATLLLRTSYFQISNTRGVQ